MKEKTDKVIGDKKSKTIFEAIMEIATTERGKGNCPKCKSKVDKEQFKDIISEREYQISGLCQDCQDEFFDGDL